MALRVPDAIGDYKILEEIGHGGMGTLFRARDPKIGRDVAIKLLREGLDDNDMRERFTREARAAGRLKHANIVTIFELGEHNGLPFIAMEYIQGQTLAALLKQRPQLPLMRKLQMMDQVCAGLHYAHRLGIVHRDIKPANLMIDEEGTMKILDFGIARMGASKITQTGVVIGTLNYMAPEQMKGLPTDARADMFSLGAVFYELLSYRNAFSGDAPSTIMHKVLYEHPEQLEVVCPNLDPSLAAIVTKALAKEPEGRYPDLGAVRAALGAVIRRAQAAGESDGNEATMPVRMSDVEATPRTPGGGRKDSASMKKMRVRAEQTRTRQLQSHLESGIRALEQKNYDAVFAACEQALVLDPTNPQALDLEARARAEVERQVQERIVEARAEIDRGALTAASLLVDQVLATSPDSPEAQSVRQEIEGARARLLAEQERERERGRAFETARSEAERHLAAGSHEAAAEAIQRALAIDATHAEALALKDQIAKAAAAREARRRAEEEARVRKAIDEARRVFGAGDHATAFAQLEGMARTYPAAAGALDALKLEAKEIERRRAEADRARLEAEAARLKRETEAARAKLEAELARLKQENEEARKKIEAARIERERDAERLRVHAEAERLKREAAARVEREAEAVRRDREAKEAARRREAEQAARQREAEQAARQREDQAARQREADAAARMSETEYDPRGLGREATLSIPREESRTPPVSVRQRTTVVERPEIDPVARRRYVEPGDDSGSRSDLPKLIALFGTGLAVVVIAAVLILRSLGQPAGGDATQEPVPAPQVQADAPPPAAPTGVPAPDQVKQQHLEQTRALVERGEYDAALQEADQVLALEAGHPEATQLRARALELKAAAESKPTSSVPAARGPAASEPQPGAKPPVAVVTTPASPPATAPSVPTAPPSPAPASTDALAARVRDLTDRYNRARSALDGGQVSNAIGLFEALQRDEPNYRDVPVQLARAREALAGSARQAMDSGTKLEASGDLPGAVQQFERARQIDQSVAGAANTAISRVRGRMKTEGTTAFTNGRQYDALDRIEQAISQYEIAVRYLADDDPNRQVARERLAALRARR